MKKIAKELELKVRIKNLEEELTIANLRLKAAHKLIAAYEREIQPTILP